MREDVEAVKAQIRAAFASTPPPRSISDGDEGDEPALLREAFRGSPDWRNLEPGFVDEAPEGLGSALSFFTADAFRYYLPAFLLADLDDKLERSDPVYHLWHGLDEETSSEKINPARYGDQTRRMYVADRFAHFSLAELRAIVAYLRLKELEDSFSRDRIHQALSNYWLPRLEGR